MSEFAVHVEFQDLKQPDTRLQRTLILDARDEFDAKIRAGVCAVHREAHKLYDGNLAFFSDVSTEIISEFRQGAKANFESHPEWEECEDPTQKDKRGRPVKYHVLNSSE